MSEYTFDVSHMDLFYNDFQALKDINMKIKKNEITALIGPSGCGKSTFLKTLNRMNDWVEGCRVTGDIRFEGKDIFKEVDPLALRYRVGMVFQQPTPFPKSIYENIAYGPRIQGIKDKKQLDAIVEKSLRQAACWDEMKDRLSKSRPRPLWWSAAASLYRPYVSSRSIGHPHGRTDICFGPDFDAENRRPGLRTEGKIYDRHCHTQHAAGPPHFR